ncbi:MAG TPA: primosomal protein N' [Bacteroidales bacterium]|nr:primosomal protein N' [Bacteroidales bacterium]
MKNEFADIVIPLAVAGSYTYRIPSHLSGKVIRGSRVAVPFGPRRIYTGLVIKVHGTPPENFIPRDISDVIQTSGMMNDRFLDFLSWLADYYLSHPGEVLKAAIPSSDDTPGRSLTREELHVIATPAFMAEMAGEGGNLMARAPRQREIADTYIRLLLQTGLTPPGFVKRSDLVKASGGISSTLNAMTAKGLFRIEAREITAITDESQISPPAALSLPQDEAYENIKRLFRDHEVVLLHGVTSSGKTELYIHLIREQLEQGKQVLYMLPEIALTTQIIERLRKHFGAAIEIYHSRMTTKSRMDIWERVNRAAGDDRLNLVLGVRSSLFLPFADLGLVIVDEEHDSSYKQYDPSPRYHARDAAMMLSRIHGARTLLGSATPSLESYHNAVTGRYGLVELKTRFGDVMMPAMMLADTREAGRRKAMSSHFAPQMLNAVEEALMKGEQVILFQNRRGFSPYIICSECGWVPGCTNCSVSYTYHKGIDKMVCHYCGKSEKPPHSCEACGSTGLVTRGFGTEKIEEEIKLIFPSATVARMDQDTTRGRNSHSIILSDFAGGATDILIGTQMISKGLDFENLTVVGILDADSMLHFPDFRAYERSFQMMEQVSGRAGRRTRRGKVIIQTGDPSHMILKQVLKHDYRAMYLTQLEERELFGYPPFTRLIRITLKHRDMTRLNQSAARFAVTLRKRLGKAVLGPEYPHVKQVQKWFLKTVLVKLGRDLSASKVKEMIRAAMEAEIKLSGNSGLRINADVDPQ